MSFKSQLLVSTFVIVAQLTTFSAEARRHNHRGDDRNNGQSQQADDNRSENRNDNYAGDNFPRGEGGLNSDEAIVSAVQNRKRLNFVQGGGMVVTKVLPDDNQGLTHQKWMVRLSNGQQMMAVYNTDMCERVPLKVGDVVAMGGQFIWSNQGALLHWLHHDPQHRRPDGFVQLNGKFYCKE